MLTPNHDGRRAPEPEPAWIVESTEILGNGNRVHAPEDILGLDAGDMQDCK